MRPDDAPQPGPTRLTPADAAALDAALGELATHAPAERDARVRAVLALLDRWHVADPPATLVDAAVARVESLRSAQAGRVTLCDDDGRALDALLDQHSADTADGPLPAGLRDRRDAVGALLGLLDRDAPGHSADPPAGLADRTLAHIERSRWALAATQSIDLVCTPSRGRQFGVRQAGTVAALVLISLSLLLPVMSKARADAEQTACRANLAKAASGLTQYANDHRTGLPTGPTFGALSAFVDDQRGEATATSAIHLLTLPREGYLRDEQLACTAAKPTLVMGGLYSAQAIEGTRALRLPTFDGPVMADTNPLYTLENGRLTRLSGWDNTASQNHRGAGQNVLMADGSVAWTLRPVVTPYDNHDNIWTQRAVFQSFYQEDEDLGHDAFLVP